MVEVTQEGEAETEGGEGHHQFLIGAESRTDGSAEKQFGHGFEVDEVPAKIEGDGIDTDPHERRRPFLELPDIDHLIECGQQQVAVSAGHEHERRGPNLFDDREIQVPKPADGEATQAEDYQPEHPFPIVEAGVL